MKVEIEPQFAKNLLAYLAEKPIKEAMGAYQVLTLAVQKYEQRLAEGEGSEGLLSAMVDAGASLRAEAKTEAIEEDAA